MRIYCLAHISEIDLKDCLFTTSLDMALEWLYKKPRARQVLGYEIGENRLTDTCCESYSIAEDGTFVHREEASCAC